MTTAPVPAETIRVHTEKRTTWITLDRPPLNVIDIPMMHALSKTLYDVTAKSDFVVFQGAGEAFSAGVEVRDHTPDRVRQMLSAFHGIFRQLWRADCVTIAAVNGYCLGGGCELAAFCDFSIATESAMLGVPEIRLGAFPPVALVTFPSLIGPRAAMHLILTGTTVSAREAHQMGLVTRVVEDDALKMEVDALLAELYGLSPLMLRMVRRELWRDCGVEFEKMLHEAEQLYLNELLRTEDCAEGIRAFLEKRPPVWKGR
jgi:cyclohexa-1,5-dienecarbonyl-CoA hydratase